jgi:hypothetical protein
VEKALSRLLLERGGKADSLTARRIAFHCSLRTKYSIPVLSLELTIDMGYEAFELSPRSKLLCQPFVMCFHESIAQQIAVPVLASSDMTIAVLDGANIACKPLRAG